MEVPSSKTKAGKENCCNNKKCCCCLLWIKLNLWIHKNQKLAVNFTSTNSTQITHTHTCTQLKLVGEILQSQKFKAIAIFLKKYRGWTNLTIVFKMHKWFCHSTFTSSSRAYNGWIFYLPSHPFMSSLCNEIVLPYPQSLSREWEREGDGFN